MFRPCSRTAVLPPTGAMKDAFESRAKDIDEYLGKFACLPGQKGLLVLIDAKWPDGHGVARVGLRGAAPQARKELRHGSHRVEGPTGRSSRTVRRRPLLPRPWRARASASSPWATAGTPPRGKALWLGPRLQQGAHPRAIFRTTEARRRATWRYLRRRGSAVSVTGLALSKELKGKVKS